MRQHVFGLSPCELQVAELHIAGHSYTQIAGLLGKAVGTVKVQLAGARGRLGARDRNELASMLQARKDKEARA